MYSPSFQWKVRRSFHCWCFTEKRLCSNLPNSLSEQWPIFKHEKKSIIKTEKVFILLVWGNSSVRSHDIPSCLKNVTDAMFLATLGISFTCIAHIYHLNLQEMLITLGEQYGNILWIHKAILFFMFKSWSPFTVLLDYHDTFFLWNYCHVLWTKNTRLSIGMRVNR